MRDNEGIDRTSNISLFNISSCKTGAYDHQNSYAELDVILSNIIEVQNKKKNLAQNKSELYRLYVDFLEKGLSFLNSKKLSCYDFIKITSLCCQVRNDFNSHLIDEALLDSFFGHKQSQQYNITENYNRLHVKLNTHIRRAILNAELINNATQFYTGESNLIFEDVLQFFDVVKFSVLINDGKVEWLRDAIAKLDYAIGVLESLDDNDDRITSLSNEFYIFSEKHKESKLYTRCCNIV